MTKKIRVLLADDHSLVRLGLSALIGYQKDFTVAGEACDGAEAAKLADEIKISIRGGTVDMTVTKSFE